MIILKCKILREIFMVMLTNIDVQLIYLKYVYQLVVDQIGLSSFNVIYII